MKVTTDTATQTINLHFSDRAAYRAFRQEMRDVGTTALFDQLRATHYPQARLIDFLVDGQPVASPVPADWRRVERAVALLSVS